MTDNNTLREFSYSHPITYKGVPYPSAPANILTDGQQTPVNVFADANGNYYVLDNNGSAKSVMPVHTLDEVVVTPSRRIFCLHNLMNILHKAMIRHRFLILLIGSTILI